MSLAKRVRDDIKDAMRAKDTDRRDALRLLSSAIKQIEIDERRELSDDDVISLIQKQIKQREDAASQYKNASRDELYDKEMLEIGIYETYLPTQLSDDELEAKVVEAIKSSSASSMKDMGRVMSLLKESLAGRADSKRISSCVKRLLA